MVLKESHCKGFTGDQQWTVNQWIENQGLEIYYEINDLLMEIISLKNRLLPGQLDIKSKHMFQMACYDLDTFRDHIIEKELLKGSDFDMNANDVEDRDDTHLLKIGLQWLKHALFDEK